MKKHLLIAAVAATMTTSVIADISITGNGKFEYFSVDTDNVSENKTNTEVNLGIKGKSGDTTVVLNLEFNTHGDDRIDVEDMYLTTKVGEASIKAGNYTTSTSAILGEIDNGGRATNKVTVSTVYNGVKIYGGNSGTAATSATETNGVITPATGDGATLLNNNMFLGVSAKVGGVTVQAKRNTADISSFGVAGSISGVDARLEIKLDDTEYKNDGTVITEGSDVVFGSVSKKLSGVTLGLAWIDADRDTLITEDDSAIFAVSNAGKGNSNTQLSVKKDMSGNVVTVKAGKIGYDDADIELNYTKLAVSRALASGTTLALSYANNDKDNNGTNDEEVKTFEADISVKF
jgi:hypothetical protein